MILNHSGEASRSSSPTCSLNDSSSTTTSSVVTKSDLILNIEKGSNFGEQNYIQNTYYYSTPLQTHRESGLISSAVPFVTTQHSSNNSSSQGNKRMVQINISSEVTLGQMKRCLTNVMSSDIYAIFVRVLYLRCENSYSLLGETNKLYLTNQYSEKTKLSFTKGIEIEYCFEIPTCIRLELYGFSAVSLRSSIDYSSSYNDDAKYIGFSRDIELIQIINGKQSSIELYSKKEALISCLNLQLDLYYEVDKNQELRELVKSSKRCDTLELETIMTEVPPSIFIETNMITFKCRAMGLDRKDLFARSDPFMVILNDEKEVFRSEIIKNMLDPEWNSFSISLSKLCENDYNKQLKVRCYDWDLISSNDLIGEFYFTVFEVLNGNKLYEIIEPNLARKKKGYKNSGIFQFLHVNEFMGNEESKNPERIIYEKMISLKKNKELLFMDYIEDGFDLTFHMAISFSKATMSLHSQGNKNSYERVLKTFGRVLENYSDCEFSMYGVSGTNRATCIIQQPFFTLDDMYINSMNFTGCERAINAYRSCLQNIDFDDLSNVKNPKTNLNFRTDDFYHLIEHVSNDAVETQKNYKLLVIMINGDDIDLQKTVDTLVDCSAKPISILILGVGSCSFSSCKILFGTQFQHGSTSKKPTRCNVKFVRLQDINENAYSKLLADIPKQFVEYFQMNKVF